MGWEQFVSGSEALLTLNTQDTEQLCNQQPEHYHQCHKQEEAGEELFIHVLRSPWNSWKTGNKTIQFFPFLQCTVQATCSKSLFYGGARNLPVDHLMLPRFPWCKKSHTWTAFISAEVWKASGHQLHKSRLPTVLDMTLQKWRAHPVSLFIVLLWTALMQVSAKCFHSME